MNEWGFIGQDIFVRIGKSATINKFKTRRGYMRGKGSASYSPHIIAVSLCFISSKHNFRGFILWTQ